MKVFSMVLSTVGWFVMPDGPWWQKAAALILIGGSAMAFVQDKAP